VRPAGATIHLPRMTGRGVWTTHGALPLHFRWFLILHAAGQAALGGRDAHTVVRELNAFPLNIPRRIDSARDLAGPATDTVLTMPPYGSLGRFLICLAAR